MECRAAFRLLPCRTRLFKQKRAISEARPEHRSVLASVTNNCGRVRSPSGLSALVALKLPPHRKRPVASEMRPYPSPPNRRSNLLPISRFQHQFLEKIESEFPDHWSCKRGEQPGDDSHSTPGEKIVLKPITARTHHKHCGLVGYRRTERR